MSNFLFYTTLSSTIDEARAQVLKGVKEGTVIIAYRQIKGRGRYGRTWEDLPGNLYMTYITYLDYPLIEALQLSFVTCVAIGQYLRSHMPPGPVLTYKWPNDLLLNGKKVGGLLIESFPVTGKGETSYLLSCGLNLVTKPTQVRYPTTSLLNENIYLSLEDVLHGITSSLESYLTLWKQKGFSPIYELWMRYAAGVDQKISFDLQGKLQTGIFKGIDPGGALLLRTADGLKKFSAGEILVH